MSFRHFSQLDKMDCGPSCIRMVSNHYGKNHSLEYLREKSRLGKNGVSLGGLIECAEGIGFKALPVGLTLKRLVEEVPMPCILHWDSNHFVVLHKIKTSRFSRNKTKFYIADPAKNKSKISQEELIDKWLNGDREAKGILLLLEPSPSFYNEDEKDQKRLTLGKLTRLLRSYKRLLIQLFLGLLAGTFIQLLFPFLTQSIVDIGINQRNTSFLVTILCAQVILSISRVSVDFVRSWILLNISMRINLSILSEFVMKLLRLPLSYFDTKKLGDLLQRVNDHNRIDSFLTSQSLTFLFSLLNLAVFGVVLAIYSWKFLIIFLIGTLLYTLWILLFLKKRRRLDYKQFDLASKSNSQLVQILQGIQEVKIANADKEVRWEWEETRVGLFSVQSSNLKLSQYQQAGGFAINEAKNIIITYLAALAVIDNEITFGVMLAVQYLVGQLSTPVDLLLEFVKQYQDAKISLERMDEIHSREDEDLDNNTEYDIHANDNRNIHLENVSFAYPGMPKDALILDDLNLTIPENKTTAIVGVSGSGKTTLIKLLLSIYLPHKGKVKIGKTDLASITPSSWREHCGVVLQDGFIFSKTMAQNIALGSENRIDNERLNQAIKLANLTELTEKLPQGFNTVIGDEGQGLSQGQKQRILIARAIYKNPDFIFFDEATNALDANNERTIMNNLYQFFQQRTVVVVAHRLSTVQKADQIIVMKNGFIVEKGNHNSLVSIKGHYYELVKNQLELGND